MNQENLTPPEDLHKIRHSAAHVLAEAVTSLFPAAQPTIGPVTQDGFFYDFYLPNQSISEADLERIEIKMREIIAQNEPIVGKQVSKNEACNLYAHNKFKLEIIAQLDTATVGIYWQGKFFDLCRGGHTERTGEVQHFKLTTVAGAHWRADVAREPLQRIYGVAFESAEALTTHLTRLEHAKLYDHRLLGKKLDLFSFLQEAPGSVFYHDKGTFVFNQLVDYSRGLQKQSGYEEIKTPIMLKEQLWHTSGHYENYKEHMFFVAGNAHETEGFAIRPMNCPCAMLLFGNELRSYKQLPLRLAEFGMVHRNELSGALHGLFRTRIFTQDDAHIFCTPTQIQEEVVRVLHLAKTVYQKFGFQNLRMALSTKPDKALGADALWQTATAALAHAMETLGYTPQYKHGEGAFYGPKIEILVTDAIGREWQCGTVQIDFFLPQRFKLEYVDCDQSRKIPVVIHRAIYGSIERFLGILLEHCKGALPFWLAPTQAILLPITDEQNTYAAKVAQQLNNARIRTTVDSRNEKISAKIRDSQLAKIPWMLVVGKREQQAEQITLRTLDGKQTPELTLQKLCQMVEEL
jgi:threonyl-tRNA synthetase